MKCSEPVSRVYASTRIEIFSWFPFLESTWEKVGLTTRSGWLRRHRLDVDVASLSYRTPIIEENRIDAEFAFNCPSPNESISIEGDGQAKQSAVSKRKRERGASPNSSPTSSHLVELHRLNAFK